MNKVNNLELSVTYRVGLGNVEMPEEVYAKILEAADNVEAISADYMKYQTALEWLSENIKEGDCTDWKCEIIHIS